MAVLLGRFMYHLHRHRAVLVPSAAGGGRQKIDPAAVFGLMAMSKLKLLLDLEFMTLSGARELGCSALTVPNNEGQQRPKSC